MRFHGLVAEEVYARALELASRERLLLDWVSALDPFGDRWLHCQMEALADKLGSSAATICRALRGLVAKGWVQRKNIGNSVFVQLLRVSPVALKTDLGDESEISPVKSLFHSCNEDFTPAMSSSDLLINKYPNTLTPEVDKKEKGNRNDEEGEAASDVLASQQTGEKALVKSELSETGKHSERPTRQATAASNRLDCGLPEGPWLVEGKLDREFVEAIANNWAGRYPGRMSDHRRNAVAHLMKNPAVNLPNWWEWYRQEYQERFEKAGQILASGGTISEDYEQRLRANHRALSASLSEEQRLVAEPIAPVAIASPVAGELPAPVAAGESDRLLPAPVASEPAADAEPSEDLWERVAGEAESFEAKAAGEPVAPVAIADLPVAQMSRGALRDPFLRMLNQWLAGTDEERERAISWAKQGGFGIQWDDGVATMVVEGAA